MKGRQNRMGVGKIAPEGCIVFLPTALGQGTLWTAPLRWCIRIWAAGRMAQASADRERGLGDKDGTGT